MVIFFILKTVIVTSPLEFLAEQLDLHAYDFVDSRTGRRHRKEILDHLGIQPANEKDKKAFADWLIQEIYPQGVSVSESIEFGNSWFYKRKIECLAKTEADRIIRSAFNSFEKNFHATVSGFFNDEAKEKMDLSLGGKDGAVELSILKADPGRIGLESILVGYCLDFPAAEGSCSSL